jgi:hypothetical protein
MGRPVRHGDSPIGTVSPVFGTPSGRVIIGSAQNPARSGRICTHPVIMAFWLIKTTIAGL